MTVDEILSEFSQRQGYFPQEAVAAAVEQQASITSHLLASVNRVAEPDTEEANNNLILFALFLLAQFREPRAYPLITHMISKPENLVRETLGDITTAGLDRILFSVFDGNPVPLKKVIEDENAYEFARSAALGALVMLYQTGKLKKTSMVEYFTELYRGRLKRDYNFVWTSLVQATARLGCDDLYDDARRAIQDDLVDEFHYRCTQFEEDLQKYTTWPQTNEQDLLINDTVAELQDWYTFKPQEEKQSGGELRHHGRIIHSHSKGTLVNETPKVGRNDPCPCGSGKKYKKCCGK